MVDWDGLVLGPCMATFGDTVTYTPAAGQPVQITGVFDEEYLEVTPMGAGPFSSTELLSLGAPGGITSARPVLGVQLSQFQVPPVQGDTLVVRGDSYIVKEVQPDGHGGAKLLLNALA